MRSTYAENVVDYVCAREQKMPFLASAYARLITWKLNDLMGLPKTAFYRYPHST